MVGVAEHDLGANSLEIISRKPAFDGAGGSDIHKGRRLDCSVNGDKFSPAGGPLLADQAIGHNVSFLFAVADSIK
jgi:hypothetical protein